MKHLRKTVPAAIAGLGLLALAAAPGIAAGGPDTMAGVAPMQLAHGPGGDHGMMGRGMMGRGMMGHGGMGMDHGIGMMRVTPILNLTTADVSRYFKRHLAMHADEQLKLGKVKIKDKDTIVADIVSEDGSLVRRLEVDRHTGWLHRVK